MADRDDDPYSIENLFKGLLGGFYIAIIMFVIFIIVFIMFMAKWISRRLGMDYFLTVALCMIPPLIVVLFIAAIFINNEEKHTREDMPTRVNRRRMYSFYDT